MNIHLEIIISLWCTKKSVKGNLLFGKTKNLNWHRYIVVKAFLSGEASGCWIIFHSGSLPDANPLNFTLKSSKKYFLFDRAKAWKGNLLTRLLFNHRNKQELKWIRLEEHGEKGRKFPLPLNKKKVFFSEFLKVSFIPRAHWERKREREKEH